MFHANVQGSFTILILSPISILNTTNFNSQQLISSLKFYFRSAVIFINITIDHLMKHYSTMH